MFDYSTNYTNNGFNPFMDSRSINTPYSGSLFSSPQFPGFGNNISLFMFNPFSMPIFPHIIQPKFTLNSNIKDYKLRKSEYTPMITKIAKEEGVNPKLLLSVIQNESGFNPNARSSCGATGLAQLMQGTAKEMGVVDIHDPEQNVRGGAKYLAKMLKRYNGDETLALAAYNAGPGAVDKHGGIPRYAETQNYVRNVMSTYSA